MGSPAPAQTEPRWWRLLQLARLVLPGERPDWYAVRDALMLLLVAVNLLFLGLDTYLSHLESGTIVGGEWVPIIFGPTAGVVMLLAGLVAIRKRQVANILATVTLLASVAVGGLGTYYHFEYAFLPAAPVGERLQLSLLLWAPPILGPLAFIMVGLLGLSAAWPETQPDCGKLRITRRIHLQLPYPKTQGYFFVVAMGVLMALVSSTFDHARTGFHGAWLYVPLLTGVFSLVATLGLALNPQPGRWDIRAYVGGMLLMAATGPVGLWMHISADLGVNNMIVAERFIRAAPVMAPMLYTDIGILGLVALIGWKPRVM